MFNPYLPENIKITRITEQTSSIKMFRFEFVQKIWGYRFSFSPGQFIELSLPGLGEAPFAPCHAPGEKYFELCIRRVGRLTEKIHEMKVGDTLGLRGPYGQGWQIETLRHPDPAAAGEGSNKKEGIIKIQDSSVASLPQNDKRANNLIIIVGGLGLIPLRSLILGKEKFLGKDAKIQIFYGAKNPNEMLFRDEYDKWRQNNIEVNLTVDKECAGWEGCVGLVTELFDKFTLLENSQVFLCGPPVMYKPAIAKLKEKGIPDEDIFLSLERRMHCGIGICQHCAVGPYYTCQDGPVFAYNKIKDIPEAI